MPKRHDVQQPAICPRLSRNEWQDKKEATAGFVNSKEELALGVLFFFFFLIASYTKGEHVDIFVKS